MNKETYISKSESDTAEIAKTISKKLENGGVILLNGDLGAGKTFTTKAIAKHLGVKNEIVKSPTYTYIQKYEAGNKNIYHIDLYRLDEYDELLANEILELTENTHNIVIIEWPERLFTKNDFYKAIDVELTYINETSREIKFSQ